MPEKDFKRLSIAALAVLLRDHDIEAISVSDITRVGKISRGNFYSAFEDMKTLLLYVKSTIESDISTMAYNMSMDRSKQKEQLHILATYAYDNRFILRAIFQKDLGSKIVDDITEIIMAKHKKFHPESLDYHRVLRSTFFTFGYFGVLEKWIMDNTPISADDLADMLYTFTND